MHRSGDTKTARRDLGRLMTRAFTRFWRERSGVAAIEFTILAVPFFLIVFAVLETSVTFAAELTLDQSVDRAARKIRTGQAQLGGQTEATLRSEICNGAVFVLNCANLKIDLKVYDKYADVPTSQPVEGGDLNTGGFGYQLPGPKQIFALRVYYKWPVHVDMIRSFLSNMSDGSYLLGSMAAFQTEPYS